ncbi:hypothetical protein KCU92_g9004, partial [Aureobasidium melanogenum]
MSAPVDYGKLVTKQLTELTELNKILEDRIRQVREAAQKRKARSDAMEKIYSLRGQDGDELQRYATWAMSDDFINALRQTLADAERLYQRKQDAEDAPTFTALIDRITEVHKDLFDGSKRLSKLYQADEKDMDDNKIIADALVALKLGKPSTSNQSVTNKSTTDKSVIDKTTADNENMSEKSTPSKKRRGVTF